MGCFAMPKGVPNKRYTPEFKKLVVETMLEFLKSLTISGIPLLSAWRNAFFASCNEN